MIAAAFLASAVVIHLTTYAPFGGTDVVQTIGLVLFLLVFPVFGLAIVSLAFSPVPFDRLIGLLPVPLKVFGVLLLVYVVADFVLMIRLVPGQPIEQNGQFFFNNHGALTPVSLERYRQGLAYQARLFTGHEIVFLGVATLVAYQLDRLRRGEVALTTPEIPTLDTEIVRRAPLSKQVVLETALPLDQCVSRLQADLERNWGWSFVSRSRLWGSVSADGFWLARERGSRSSPLFATGRFSPQPAGTSIQINLQLKRWGWPSLVVSAALVPVVGAVVDWATGGGHLVTIVFTLVAFIAIGNVVVILFERRRLLSAIEEVLSARRH